MMKAAAQIAHKRAAMKKLARGLSRLCGLGEVGTRRVDTFGRLEFPRSQARGSSGSYAGTEVHVKVDIRKFGASRTRRQSSQRRPGSCLFASVQSMR